MSRPQLPLEMISEILARVTDKADLLALRLSSRYLNDLATPMAFSSLTITPNISSARHLMQLQGCDNLAQYVKEIRFNGEVDNDGEPLDLPDLRAPADNSVTRSHHRE